MFLNIDGSTGTRSPMSQLRDIPVSPQYFQAFDTAVRNIHNNIINTVNLYGIDALSQGKLNMKFL